jgi:hypothetical protein
MPEEEASPLISTAGKNWLSTGMNGMVVLIDKTREPHRRAWGLNVLRGYNYGAKGLYHKAAGDYRTSRGNLRKNGGSQAVSVEAVRT